MEKEKRKFIKYSKQYNIPLKEFYIQKENYLKSNLPFTRNDIIKKVLRKFDIIPCSFKGNNFDYYAKKYKLEKEYKIRIRNKIEFKLAFLLEKNNILSKKNFGKSKKIYDKTKSYKKTILIVKYNIHTKNKPHIYYYLIDREKYIKNYKNRNFIEKYGQKWLSYISWLKAYNLDNNRINAKKYIIIKKYNLFRKNKKLFYRLGCGYQNWKKVYQAWKESITISEEKFIQKYGEKLGKQKWNEFKKKVSYKQSKEYFIENFGYEEGLKKYKELNEKKRLSEEKFIQKYGEKEGKQKWEEFCQKNSYTNTLEYYIETYGEEEGKKRYENWKYEIGKSLRIEYIMEKYNVNEKTAKKMLKERQATNRLDKLICKFGPIQGYIKWYNRQQNWQDTLNSKSEKEKKEINKKKAITLDNMIKKYGKIEGTKRYFQWKEKISSHPRTLQFYSKESIKFLEPIYDFLLKNDFIESDVFWKENEFRIYDKENKRYRYYDFTIPKINVIIEYHGSMWHYNPNYNYPENFRNPYANLTIEELKENDQQKRNLAIKNGFKIFEVFDTDNFEEKQKDIIKYIKEEIL